MMSEQQLVIFSLAGEDFGVEIGIVESIIKMQPVTLVPHAPEFVEGITNLRGVVLPVVDLRKRFSLPAVAVTKDSRIVVVVINDLKVGMIVDGVSEVLRIHADMIDPPSPLVTSVDTDFLKGIAKLEERLIILLDLRRVLTPSEKTALAKSAALEKALAAAPA
jgi:purine-binding chemotaxis protein CheW